jgi:hypothetical protein
MSTEEFDAAMQRHPPTGSDPRFISAPSLNPFLSMAGMPNAAALNNDAIPNFVPSDFSRLGAGLGGPSAAEQQRYDATTSSTG